MVTTQPAETAFKRYNQGDIGEPTTGDILVNYPIHPELGPDEAFFQGVISGSMAREASQALSRARNGAEEIKRLLTSQQRGRGWGVVVTKVGDALASVSVHSESGADGEGAQPPESHMRIHDGDAREGLISELIFRTRGPHGRLTRFSTVPVKGERHIPDLILAVGSGDEHIGVFAKRDPEGFINEGINTIVDSAKTHYIRHLETISLPKPHPKVEASA